jgi:hypothetical protein
MSEPEIKRRFKENSRQSNNEVLMDLGTSVPREHIDTPTKNGERNWKIKQE